MHLIQLFRLVYWKIKNMVNSEHDLCEMNILANLNC
jgi:hypothetical protein